MSEAKYAIGIDLGTTHCVLSYASLEQENADELVHQVFEIAQLTAPGQVESLPALPSFLYMPHAEEIGEGELSLPWGAERAAVGAMARDMGSKTPTRLISSAKSWLSHGQVDRRSAFLPLDAPKELDKQSPFDASKAYLQHMKTAWNHAFPDTPLEQQSVTITVPASFDPGARELTGLAAKEVGLGQFTLLEEPQAALYSWIAKSQGKWRDQVSVGDVILVVDVGGGTTDLSLIAVTEEEGSLQLNRVAVGDHILLGGDNMDLALANAIRMKLAKEGTQLQPWQLIALSHGCRDAKEKLTTNVELGAVPIVVPSRGSSLISGSLRTELTREELDNVVINGFFPEVGIDAEVQNRARSALTRLALPYAQDPAITRHIAAFLRKQLHSADNVEGHEVDGSFIKPTAIMFNGGVIKAEGIAQRITSVLNGWLEQEGASSVKVLEGIDLDKAVANGAAYYSFIRQGKGVRIRGGIPASYYVGIESALPAVPGMEQPIQAYCIASFGMEEGTEASLPDQEFGLVVGEPVRFRFFSSTIRRDDEPGLILDFWNEGELEELAPIEMNLPADGRQPGQIVPVQLMATVNALGTLELVALPNDGDEQWQVELDTRGQAA